jgi:hypothetical protein
VPKGVRVRVPPSPPSGLLIFKSLFFSYIF